MGDHHPAPLDFRSQVGDDSLLIRHGNADDIQVVQVHRRSFDPISAGLRPKYVGLRELARMAGLSTAAVWTIEHGGHRSRPATLRKIAAALGLSADEMVAE
jgi:transcriptional regulator with XRE-family HTH domain